MPWPVLVFDIESIPDIQGLRLLRDAPAEATDAEVYGRWLQERKDAGQETVAQVSTHAATIRSTGARAPQPARRSRQEIDGVSGARSTVSAARARRRHGCS